MRRGVKAVSEFVEIGGGAGQRSLDEFAPATTGSSLDLSAGTLFASDAASAASTKSAAADRSVSSDSAGEPVAANEAT